MVSRIREINRENSSTVDVFFLKENTFTWVLDEVGKFFIVQKKCASDTLKCWTQSK